MAEEKNRAADLMGAWWEEASNERTQRLKYLRSAAWGKHPYGGEYAVGVGICTERMFWFTKSFMESSISLPWKIRRAMAIAKHFENTPIFIMDNAMLVGYDAAKPSLFPHHHEISGMVNQDVFYDRTDYLTGDKVENQKIFEYWKDKTYESIAERYFSMEELRAGKMAQGMMSAPWLEAMSSANIPYENVFKYGLKGLIDLAREQFKKTEEILSSGTAEPGKNELLPRLDQYRAMNIAGEAALGWINRYSRLARIVADNFETNAKRKAELIKISETCAKIAVSPPEHLYEALQLHVLVSIVAKLIERSHTGWGCRPDVIFSPFYDKDVIVEKNLTREEVLELMCEWRIRIFEYGKSQGRMYRTLQQGFADPRVLTVGGQKPDGRDACNDLTEIICDATRIIRTSVPSVAFSYHPNASVTALRSAYRCVQSGNGMPSFESNTTHINQLMGNFGATLEESRTWANVVCKSPGVTTDRGQAVRYAVAMHFMPKVLEMALYQGKDAAVTGLQAWPSMGDPCECKTWDEFVDLMKKVEEYMVNLICRCRNKARWVEAQYMNQPFLSLLYMRCIENGVDAVEPYELGNPWLTVNCMGDFCESLYPIKKMIFDDKKYSMAQLIEALKADWEGYEEMRAEFIALPKWGNDIDEVDEVYRQGYDMATEIYKKNHDLTGAPYLPLPNTNGPGGFIGRFGAMPYGRGFNDFHSDGGSSPWFGADKKGPTAVLRSCSKLDAAATKGILLNQRLSPTQLQGEKGFQLWFNYMRTWHDLGIDHIQFNMVDNETLRAAQREPEKYAELIVRVAGYSAHFVGLNRAAQDSIVARAVHEV